MTACCFFRHLRPAAPVPAPPAFLAIPTTKVAAVAEATRTAALRPLRNAMKLGVRAETVSMAQANWVNGICMPESAEANLASATHAAAAVLFVMNFGSHAEAVATQGINGMAACPTLMAPEIAMLNA